MNCLSKAYCKCDANVCQLSRITPISSQVLTVFLGNEPINITLDSGATTSFITRKLCKKLKLKVSPNGQLAQLGNGCTVMASVGEIDQTFTRDKWSVRFRAIVVEKLNTDIYGGTTFMVDNDISVRPKTGEIKIHNKFIVFQTNMLMTPPLVKAVDLQSRTVKLPKKQVIFPDLNRDEQLSKNYKGGTLLKVSLPEEMRKTEFVFIEPRHENKFDDWPPPQLCKVDHGEIQVENQTSRTISIHKDVHILNVNETRCEPVSDVFFDSIPQDVSDGASLEMNYQLVEKGIENAKNININRAPDQLQEKLKSAHLQFADVFSPDLSTGYNGYSGKHFVQLHFADENRPQMSKCYIPKWAGKNDQVKQRKMDMLESQGVLIDPYKTNVSIKMISPSFLRVKARAKDKDLEDCDLTEIRWIISPCQLNPYLRQLQTNNITKEDLFIFKSEKPYCIEFDMYEGYFQNHVRKEDWGYLAVETPFKGIRVLTRSGQGLLNQEIEMNQLLTKVLGEEIQKGNVIIQADDGQVGGKTEEETVDNWIKVLELCSKNNIKINHKKVKILPETSLIHGWLFKDGYVEPDPHRKLAILDMKPPKTIGEMRTYMGVYKTFFPAMRRLVNLMAPFEALCGGGKESKQAIKWNDVLDEQFKESQKVAQTDVKALALPHPNEQLFIVPDAASRPPALGFILFVHREPLAEPVMFVTWKLGESYWTWSPCELEGLGASIAVEKCAFYILRSSKPTLVFPDNKQVIQAYNKLQKGRYSTSQRLATFTNNIQKYPIVMQHGSGKLLQNIGADYIGRNAVECKDDKCAVCKFVDEKSQTILSNIFSLISSDNSISQSEVDLKSYSPNWRAVLAESKNIPIGNIQAWIQLQSNDEAIQEAIRLLKSGQIPPKDARNISEIRNYVSKCKFSSSSKLLVKEDPILYDYKKDEKIVVPNWFLLPLLTQMHQDQDCPEPNQLNKVFDRYFYGYQVGNLFRQVSEDCRVCQARKKIPKDLKHFQSITNPGSPGENFVADVMRRSKQFIFTTRDAFSDFVTACLIKSEKAEDLKEGLITTTSALRRKSPITVRVDNAPAFQSLVKAKDKDLKKLNVTIELSDSKNKNGVAIVDKAIQELEKEIVAISPENKPISASELARATIALNSRIRNRDLSSYEIMFSREQATGTNILLDDKTLAEKKWQLKNENHKYSEKSKYPRGTEPTKAGAEKGDFVFLKEDGGKHKLRDPYLVLKCEGDNVILTKMLHTLNKDEQTKMSSKKIKAHQSDIYKSNINNSERFKLGQDNSSTQEAKETFADKEENAVKAVVWTPFGKDDKHSSSDSDSSTDVNYNTANNEAESSAGSTGGTNSNDTNDVVDSEDPDSNEDDFINPHQDHENDVDLNLGELTDNLQVQGVQELFDIYKPNPSDLPTPGDKILFVDHHEQPLKVVGATVTRIFKTVQKKYPGWFNIQRDDFHLETSVDLLRCRWMFLPILAEAGSDDEGNTLEDGIEPDHDENDDLNFHADLDEHNVAFQMETPLYDPLHMPFDQVENLDNVLPLNSTPKSPPRVVHSRPRLSDV